MRRNSPTAAELLISDDRELTAEEKLGFACQGTWMDPPVYAIVARNGKEIACIWIESIRQGPSLCQREGHVPDEADVVVDFLPLQESYSCDFECVAVYFSGDVNAQVVGLS